MILSFRKLIKVIYFFWTTSLASELEYKLNFYIEILTVIGNIFGSIILLSIFYSKGDTLGGWNWQSALMVLGTYSILESFTISLLQPNLNRIVKHVQNGTLDYILLKPIDTQLWISLRVVTPWGLPSLIAGISLIIFGIFRQNLRIGIQSIMLTSLLLVSAIIILYSLWFVIATTSIWFVKTWNANEVLRSILVAGRYPVSSFPPFLRTIFTFVIPIAFLTTIPVKPLLGLNEINSIFISIIFALILFFVSRRFWTFALKFYTSASS